MAANQTYFLQGGSATVAAAGVAQGTATALVKQINLVTVGTTNFGVILPLAYGGMDNQPILVVNTNGAANNLKVYPPTGGTIDGGSANVAIDVAAGAQSLLYAVDANDYRSLTGTISATQAGFLSGVTAGTVTASKALVVDSSKNLATLGTLASGAQTIAGTETVTTTSANGLAVGRQGATTPVLNLDCSVATNVTGINIIGRAAAAGVDVAVTSSGTDEPLFVNAKGAGLINIGGTSTGAVAVGLGSTKGFVSGSTKTAIATQNAAPTAAQLLGGYLSHTSVTGAGTLTPDTAANIDTALGSLAVTGASFEVVYANIGSQTVTLTTNTGLSLKGTVAVTTGKVSRILFVRTGAGAYDVIQTVSA